jgi:hypothetical protein
MTRKSKKIVGFVSKGLAKLLEEEGWICSLNHPKITPELRDFLERSFTRLAKLNIRKLSNQKLSKAEKLEQSVLAELHTSFRYGLGLWANFKGKKYFAKKYEPRC